MYPVASFPKNHLRFYLNLAWSPVPAALEEPSHCLHRTVANPAAGPFGNNLDPLTCSAVWPVHPAQACILMYMYFCSASRHTDAFKLSLTDINSLCNKVCPQYLSTYTNMLSLACITSMLGIFM